MMGQTNVYSTKPFKQHTINSTILCADYDMGRDGYAYHDTVSGDYHVDGGNRTGWNNGTFYRNDGVDIGNDNGKPYVGWTDDGEWMQYTIDIPKTGLFDLEIRTASEEISGAITIEVNDEVFKDKIELPLTHGKTNWQVSKIENIKLPNGKIKLRFLIVKGGSNLLEFKIVSK
jgi:hypothetical protein